MKSFLTQRVTKKVHLLSRCCKVILVLNASRLVVGFSFGICFMSQIKISCYSRNSFPSTSNSHEIYVMETFQKLCLQERQSNSNLLVASLGRNHYHDECYITTISQSAHFFFIYSNNGDIHLDKKYSQKVYLLDIWQNCLQLDQLPGSFLAAMYY